jgi:hypothetical protein
MAVARKPERERERAEILLALGDAQQALAQAQPLPVLTNGQARLPPKYARQVVRRAVHGAHDGLERQIVAEVGREKQPGALRLFAVQASRRLLGAPRRCPRRAPAIRGAEQSIEQLQRRLVDGDWSVST